MSKTQDFPEIIHVVDYAGYLELQDGEYYEDTRLLHTDEYPQANEFADEVCRRWKEHPELQKKVEELNNEISILQAGQQELAQTIIDQKNLIDELTMQP